MKDEYTPADVRALIRQVCIRLRHETLTDLLGKKLTVQLAGADRGFGSQG